MGGINMEKDYVSQAEKAIGSLVKTNKGKTALNTAQIRKILSATVAIKNKLQVERGTHGGKLTMIPHDLVMDIRFLKSTFLYQAARDAHNNPRTKPVADFLEKTQLVKEIETIGDKTENFDRFCKYVEALVAFHKYQIEVVEAK